LHAFTRISARGGILDEGVILYGTWLIHSSFSKRCELVGTRKLEQYWLSPQAFTRIKKSFHFFFFKTAAMFIVLGLAINQFDRNVDMKSGFSPSFVHFKHSHD